MFRVLRQDRLLKENARRFSQKVWRESGVEIHNFWDSRFGAMRDLPPVNSPAPYSKDWSQLFMEHLDPVGLSLNRTGMVGVNWEQPLKRSSDPSSIRSKELGFSRH